MATLTIDLTELRNDPGMLRSVMTLLRDAAGATGGETQFFPEEQPGNGAPRSKTRTRRRKSEAVGSWAEFEATLSEQTRKFLAFVKERGTATLPGALAHLGLIEPKALGGLTGALQRKAGNRGVVVPFTVGEDAAGHRTWTWALAP